MNTIFIWSGADPPKKEPADANRRAKVRGTSKQLSPEGKLTPRLRTRWERRDS